MRATLIALIGTLTLTACAPGSDEVPADSLVTRRDLVYEVNSDDPFTGVAVSYHSSGGQVLAKGTYKEGLPDGPFEFYYANGQLMIRGAFQLRQNHERRAFFGFIKAGVGALEAPYGVIYTNPEKTMLGELADLFEGSIPHDGTYEAYYANGQLVAMGAYKDGEMHGAHEVYSENGQPREKITYKEGQLHGASEEYDENGQLREMTTYKDGLPDGPFELYYANGQLAEMGTYKDGQPDGAYEAYYVNGQLQEKAAYTNGQKDGAAEFYHENGQLEKTETYREGQLHGIQVIYFENGQLREEATYKDGERDGAYETYHPNGQLREKGSLKEGQPDGAYETYHPNGQLREKKTYANGQLDGTFESYDESGQLREKKTYKTGQVDGPYESYYANGQLREKGTRKGEQSWDGAYETYHPNGQLRRRENYKDGDRDGLAQNYDENGQLLKLDLPVMAGIPAGSFPMGCVSGRNCRNNERPVHTVTISQPFALSKHEVTFSQWEACVLTGGCNGYHPADEGWGRGNRPVINVSWQDAQSYVSWLSQETGEDYRLPSEAEWEFAARAGSTTKYSWGNEMGRNRANCDGCGSPWDDRSTAPVGSFAANPFDLHDMHGNVFEWVEDCGNDRYTGAPSNGSAWLNGNCGGRVVRGGSWGNNPRILRSAYRGRSTTSYRGDNLGFRVALTRTQ